MSLESSSLDRMRSLGQPANLPGAEESAKAAQEFPQPEFRTSAPDIRMQQQDPFGLNNLNQENGNEHRAEDEANNRFYYRQGESLSS